ncbi:hypothetical protein [Pseudomonas oryzicola]|uniref:Uncharacterized protein n=1 Tax=Pseudomonas oryzicola TaxID=485876 RepID=A0ABS6Q9E5_9PSED|nr:hypothetical protein [Pseudomonas oryzicola]MBV4490795.1 hypothetical protein [Pseudomonas oryzicola]
MRKDLLKDMDTFNAQIQTKFSQHDNKLLVRLGMMSSLIAGIIDVVLRSVIQTILDRTAATFF